MKTAVRHPTLDAYMVDEDRTIPLELWKGEDDDSGMIHIPNLSDDKDHVILVKKRIKK